MSTLYIRNESGEFVPITTIQGPPGKSSYIHFKYGNSPTPEVLSDEPDIYLGISVTDTPEAPASYHYYKWSLIGAYIGDHVGSGGSAHALVTEALAGFMSPEDKAKLDDIEDGAQKNELVLANDVIGGIEDLPPAYPASMITIADLNNKYDATTVEDALSEIALRLDNNINDINDTIEYIDSSIENIEQSVESTVEQINNDIQALQSLVSDQSNQIESHINDENAHNNLFDQKLDKTGGTLDGKLIAQANTDYTTYQVRNIALSTTASTPTGNGSILGVYE